MDRVKFHLKFRNASREIQANGGGSTANRAQCVATDVAVEMEDLLAGYVTQLCGLDVMEGVFASSKAIKHVITGHVARMNDCALIPVASVYLNGVGHSGAEQSCAGGR